MSRIEKLQARFKEQPSDFSWDELEKLLVGLGYVKLEGAGSRVKFRRDNSPKINLHKPHPGKIIKMYVMKQVLEHLQNGNLL